MESQSFGIIQFRVASRFPATLHFRPFFACRKKSSPDTAATKFFQNKNSFEITDCSAVRPLRNPSGFRIELERTPQARLPPSQKKHTSAFEQGQKFSFRIFPCMMRPKHSRKLRRDGNIFFFCNFQHGFSSEIYKKRAGVRRALIRKKAAAVLQKQQVFKTSGKQRRTFSHQMRKKRFRNPNYGIKSNSTSPMDTVSPSLQPISVSFLMTPRSLNTF